MEESTPFSPLNVYVGYDVREHEAFEVCRWSLARRSSVPVTVRKLDLVDLVKDELYWRGWREDDRGRKIDMIDGKGFATSFSFSRFLVPELARRRHLTGYAIFVDCDFLFVNDIAELLPRIDPSKAVSCVKHDYRPKTEVKMDGQVQEPYAKKLWSSLMVFNLDHPALSALTPEYVNTATGADLHQFRWLASDELIGQIDPVWNFVAGHTRLPSVTDQIYGGRKLSAIHFTEGLPIFEEYANCDYSAEWLAERAHWRAFQAGR
jgi:lipopolysaccharide biosynthesis glycosyltransferase